MLKYQKRFLLSIVLVAVLIVPFFFKNSSGWQNRDGGFQISEELYLLPYPSVPFLIKSYSLASLGNEEIRYDLLKIIKKYDWNQYKAYDVMMCESGGDNNAYNSEKHKNCRGSHGLFQIACVHAHYVNNINDLKDATINIEVAYKIYKLYGWGAWKNCDKLTK